MNTKYVFPTTRSYVCSRRHCCRTRFCRINLRKCAFTLMVSLVSNQNNGHCQFNSDLNSRTSSCPFQRPIYCVYFPQGRFLAQCMAEFPRLKPIAKCLQTWLNITKHILNNVMLGRVAIFFFVQFT
jgi:hypothetical protein